MLRHDGLAEELGSITLALGPEDLVVLVKLLPIVLDGLTKLVSIRDSIPILDIVQLLQAVDSNRKYLTCGLKHR